MTINTIFHRSTTVFIFFRARMVYWMFLTNVDMILVRNVKNAERGFIDRVQPWPMIHHRLGHGRWIIEAVVNSTYRVTIGMSFLQWHTCFGTSFLQLVLMPL